MISVLIVEDDPMVAEFNKQFLQELNGFKIGGVANQVDEAIEIIKSERIDLVLLDVFMPGKSGLDFLSYIRELNENMDVILITAASDMEHIQSALRLGAVDYIIKPFKFERFKESLMNYAQKKEFMKEQTKVSQSFLDEQILNRDQKAARAELPKGLTKETLKIVWNAIEAKLEQEFTTDIIADETKISRVSVRKYLNFLNEQDIIKVRLTYGSIGRPVNVYYLNTKRAGWIEQFL